MTRYKILQSGFIAQVGKSVIDLQNITDRRVLKNFPK